MKKLFMISFITVFAITSFEINTYLWEFPQGSFEGITEAINPWAYSFVVLVGIYAYFDKLKVWFGEILSSNVKFYYLFAILLGYVAVHSRVMFADSSYLIIRNEILLYNFIDWLEVILNVFVVSLLGIVQSIFIFDLYHKLPFDEVKSFLFVITLMVLLSPIFVFQSAVAIMTVVITILIGNRTRIPILVGLFTSISVFTSAIIEWIVILGG